MILLNSLKSSQLVVGCSYLRHQDGGGRESPNWGRGKYMQIITSSIFTNQSHTLPAGNKHSMLCTAISQAQPVCEI